MVKGKPRRQPYCHVCMAAYVRNRYATSAEYRAQVAERDRRDSSTEKRLARIATQRAIRSGQLQPGPCEIAVDCRGVIEAQHDDYSRPFDVRWLCKKHHAQTHSQRSPALDRIRRAGA